jgi:hypothetical protein
MEEWIIRQREEALRHPTRRALLELLGKGDLTTRELRDRLPGEPSLSEVVYHLAVLRAGGWSPGRCRGATGRHPDQALVPSI